jgi:hypothetical protein
MADGMLRFFGLIVTTVISVATCAGWLLYGVPGMLAGVSVGVLCLVDFWLLLNYLQFLRHKFWIAFVSITLLIPESIIVIIWYGEVSKMTWATPLLALPIAGLVCGFVDRRHTGSAVPGE